MVKRKCAFLTRNAPLNRPQFFLRRASRAKESSSERICAHFPFFWPSGAARGFQFCGRPWLGPYSPLIPGENDSENLYSENFQILCHIRSRIVSRGSAQNFVLIQPRTNPAKICKKKYLLILRHSAQLCCGLAWRPGPWTRCSPGRAPETRRASRSAAAASWPRSSPRWVRSSVWSTSDLGRNLLRTV